MGMGGPKKPSWGCGILKLRKRIPDFPRSENGGRDAGWELGRGSLEKQAEG